MTHILISAETGSPIPLPHETYIAEGFPRTGDPLTLYDFRHEPRAQVLASIDNKPRFWMPLEVAAGVRLISELDYQAAQNCARAAAVLDLDTIAADDCGSCEHCGAAWERQDD